MKIRKFAKIARNRKYDKIVSCNKYDNIRRNIFKYISEVDNINFQTGNKIKNKTFLCQRFFKSC